MVHEQRWADTDRRGGTSADALRAVGVVLCGIASAVCAAAIGTVFSQFADLLRAAILL